MNYLYRSVDGLDSMLLFQGGGSVGTSPKWRSTCITQLAILNSSLFQGWKVHRPEVKYLHRPLGDLEFLMILAGRGVLHPDGEVPTSPSERSRIHPDSEGRGTSPRTKYLHLQGVASYFHSFHIRVNTIHSYNP